MESLLSKYSLSVISLPSYFNSNAKSLSNHKKLGFELLELPFDFELIKFEISAARDNSEIEVSSIVCIELYMNKLLKRTTSANILAS